MKHVHQQTQNRWPVLIACAVLCAIVIAGAKKWSHKEAVRDSVAGSIASDNPTERESDFHPTPEQSTKVSDPTFRSANAERGETRRTKKQGLSDADRASLPLDQFLRAEGIDVDRLQPDPESIERRLQVRADSLTQGQRLDLRERILSTDTPISEKEVAIHLLSLNVPAAVPVLKSIAVAPVPESKSAESLSPELPLRLTAVEGLEKASLRDSQYRRSLLEVAERAPNKTVREVAQLSAQQAAKGHSFFDDYTKQLAGDKHK